MRTISTSKGCRSIKSVDCGLRPSASETSLPAPTNFPLGEDQGSSASALVFILCMGFDFLQSTKTSGDDQGFARDPGRVGGSEKHGGTGYILWLSDAAQRRLRLNLLSKIAFGNAGGVCALRFHHARIDGVDTNLARPEFLGQRLRYGIHRRLGGAVNRAGRRSGGAGD